MAAPKVKFKRSSVAHKAPGLANLELGELALNTYDGKLFTRKDTGGVGIATTVTVLNPWDENYGGGSITYAGIVTSGGGGSSTDYTEITVSGFSPSSFNQTYQRQSTGFTLDTGTVSSGNALFNTNSNYYYYTATTGTDSEDRMLIFSEEDNAWFAVFSFADPDYTSNNNNEALGPTGVNVFAYSIATGSDTADGRNVPPASDSNITYGTSVGGITTSRVGVVTITQEGHAQYAGVVTAYSFSGDVSGNLTGNVTGTASSASVANQVFTQRNETSGNYYFTFVDDNNVAPSANTLYTDTTLNVNPYTNIVSGGGMDMVAYFINSVQITSTATELNILDGATLSTSELNILDGVTASTSELNILDGVTATTAELNYTDGVTSNIQTQLDNIVSLTGVSAGSTTFGTFSGTTISDNKDLKTVLQELETAVDNVVGGNSGSATILTQSTSTNSSHYLTFVTDNNGSATQESIKTDDALSYNPSTNILTVGGSGHIVSNVVGDIIGDLVGTADVADNVSVTNISTTDVDFTLVMSDGSNTSTGRALGMDSSLTYNPNTNILTAETVNGNLTGNVTGDVTGTASTANTLKTQLTVTNANHYLTFVNSNNSSATAETVHTDSSLHYNPLTNQFTAPGVNVTILSIDGTDVTSTAAELNILDGATVTTAELNVLDGISSIDTDLTSVSGSDDTLASAKAIKTYVDAQVTASDLDFAGDSGTGAVDLDSQTFTIAGTSNEIETSVSGQTLTVGLPDNVSVFNNLTVGGNITIGGTLTYEDVANVDSVGLITARSGVIVNGAGIGLSVTEGGARITGVTTSSGGFVGNLTGNVTGNVSGNVTGNLDGIVGGNTPAAVTGTTITANTGFTGDLTGDVTGDVTGTATTATNAVQLQTARNIGGVSFNGTADINLPGVNAAGNQDTTGNAATATALETARTIGGVSFDGTGNINLPGVNATGNQDTSGNAATATSLATARTIHGVSFDGTSNIDLSEVIQDTVGGMFASNTETGITVTYEDSDGTIDLVVGTLNQDTTGTAALAEGLTGTPNITVGVVTASSLDISGNVDVDGTLEADAITIDGVSLAETISDTVGSMVSSNTETNITVTYDDSDNTLDFVIGTLNQDTSGNAATATALETARNIGGVSFNGTADINLPGVNQAGNQNTSGTAAGLSGSPSITVTDITATGNVSIAGTLTYEDVTSIDSVGLVTARSGVRVTTGGLTVSAGGANITGGITGDLTGDVTGNADTATRLATARTLGGVSFDGTGNINLPGVNATGNQDTSGNAATATALETARTIGGVSFDGTGNINLPGVNAAGNQDTTGNAATATALATARTIAGVSFDGTSNISLNNNAITNGAGYITTSFTNTNQLTNGAGFITNSVTGDFSVSGNISIGGTLTYEDVTNVDSVGVVTARSGIKVPDGQKINVGSSDDLQIYHGGNHSYIDDAGTGNLRLRSGTIEITNLAGSKKSAEFNSGGGQELYHNNNKKFETTSSGATITGGLVAGGLTYPTSDGTANQVLVTDGSGNLSFANQSLPTGVTTTTTTNETSIDTFDSATYSTGIYHIQATRGGDVELTNFTVIHNGTDTFITEYGTVSTGPGIATYSADINSGNVRLLAYPSSASTTVFKNDRTLIETGAAAAGSTTTTSTSQTNIDTLPTTYKAVVYEVEVSRGTAVHLTTINLVHDGTSVYLSEFGTVKSGNSLATFDADIDGSTIRLRATPTTADSTTFNVNRTVMS